MTVDRVVGSKAEVAAPKPSVADVLLDGMFTGMIGALLVFAQGSALAPFIYTIF